MLIIKTMIKNDSNPNRILYLLDDPSKDNGLHSCVLKGLEKAGFKPIICYFYGNSQDSVMVTRKTSAISLGLSRTQYKKCTISNISRLRRLISEQNISLIHCQRHRALEHAAFASYRTDVKALFYTVGSTNVLRNRKRRLVFNYLASRISRVICVSSAVKGYMLKMARMLSENKTLVIHNGVDIQKFDIDLTRKEARRLLNIPEDGFYFGIVARLKKAKCHDILLRAFARTVQHIPATRLAIVGDGPLEANLKKLAQQLRISDSVYFIGRVEYAEVPRTLKAFNCFVHPSFREGLGVAILEAMASGLPVIATNADGITDIFDTAANIGKMVPPKDVEALFSSMMDFRTKGSDVLQNIGKEARSHVRDNFSQEAMVKANIEVYGHVLTS